MSILAPEDRFWSKVWVDPSGCWEWTGARVRGGYGKFFTHKERMPDGRRRTVLVPAHRWSYERLVGPIPEGLQIDHLCRNKGCVNSAHLEPVTISENIRRVPRPPTCGKGHIYTPANTFYRQGTRRCRECKRIRERARYYRVKARKAVA